MGDWLQMGCIKTWMGKASIPMAFMVCGLVCLAAALSLTKLTVWVAQISRAEIEDKYEMTVYIPPEDMVFTDEVPLTESDDMALWQEVTLVDADDFQGGDRQAYAFFGNLEDVAAILWYSVCLVLAALIFYHWKIKKPLSILNHAAQEITDNNLDFQIADSGTDELGRLCHAFEIMRRELVQNNRNMWNAVEERKRLNAAFAHDLKTPLTVIQGHTDLLVHELGDHLEAQPELLESITSIQKQIKRLNSYVSTMGDLQRLEDYDPRPREIPAQRITEAISETAQLLFPHGEVEFHSSITEQLLVMDLEAFLQIYENILSNAARYAKHKIAVSLDREGDVLTLSITDDGIGFSQKDLQYASAPYYRGEKPPLGSTPHFGLGLYICHVLAEKLGGSLHLANSAEGGAQVTVKICCI